MGEIAIRVEDLYKQYRLGTVNTGAISHDLNRWWHKVRGKEDPYQKVTVVNDRTQKTNNDYVWALNNISFDVQAGEVLGIIGKNGAGKSTLLKVLSKVTGPTKGNIKVNGRIASLLEVGTGFHPELSGRENVFLNGAILGMSKAEIKRKFDDIVDFSGVDKYVDTPVKRYSSGMYVRLAFAVAAHLESEILIVDEVLAVGDSEFQKKCLGKMKDVSKGEGRTVLFVSHNMAAVENICSHALVLKNGTVAFPKGAAKEGIQFYNQSVIGELVNTQFIDRKDRTGNGNLQFTSLNFIDATNQIIEQPVCGAPTVLRLNYTCKTKIRTVSVAIGFNSLSGENKFIVWTELLDKDYKDVEGTGHFNCKIEKFPLSPGRYLVNIFAKTEGGEILDWLQDALSVDVENGDFYGSGKNITTSHNSVLIEHSWT
ncbi:MAG TPA: ABC transporter ATP-binding protein [Bacteroidia bacterium]|nr:ABC transporter ATP-binding protein [Bacteroidia bacterium]